MTEKKENKSVTDMIEEVREKMCNEYCKYPDTWDAEKEGMELSEIEICDECPLNRL